MQKNNSASADYPAARWRLVNSGFADGSTNMAIDEAILEAVAARRSPPTLRFYGWRPACLSLGFRQPSSLVDRERCSALGWDVVRRPTGGRAILHVDELTYSVVAPVDEPRVRGTILASYRRLSKALTIGLRLLGLTSAEAPQEPSPPAQAGPACFDGPSNYEISHNGRKLVGSAQVRKKNIVLQHGTLPLVGDVGRVAEALYFESREEKEELAVLLRRQATTLAAALARDVTFDEAATALAVGFSQALNLTLFEAALTPLELARTAELRSEKYAAKSWALRR